jgi:uncharacterized membrane protein
LHSSDKLKKKHKKQKKFKLTGLAAPLISSILGTIILLITAHILYYLSSTLNTDFLQIISQFIINKIHYFFAISLLFNLNEYFQENLSSYKYISPIINAVAATLMVWIFSHIFNTINIYSKLQFLQDISNLLYNNLSIIFIIILALGYISVLLEKFEGKK